MTDQTRALYERAITAYGEGHQLVKAMEELGELTQDIAKYTNMQRTGATAHSASAGSAGLASRGCAPAGRGCQRQRRDCYTAIPGSDAEAEALRAARDHVAEEIADVGIILDQVRMLLGIGSAAARWRWKKLMRLRQRLEDECDEHV